MTLDDFCPPPSKREVTEYWKKYAGTARALYEERKRVYEQEQGATPSELELKTEVAHILKAIDELINVHKKEKETLVLRTLYLPESLDYKLRQLAFQEDKSKNELIRELLASEIVRRYS